jgi:hypothetical protein
MASPVDKLRMSVWVVEQNPRDGGVVHPCRELWGDGPPVHGIEAVRRPVDPLAASS